MGFIFKNNAIKIIKIVNENNLIRISELKQTNTRLLKPLN